MYCIIVLVLFGFTPEDGGVNDFIRFLGSFLSDF